MIKKNVSQMEKLLNKNFFIIMGTLKMSDSGVGREPNIYFSQTQGSDFLYFILHSPTYRQLFSTRL